MTVLKARLHPLRVGGGYVYSVIFEGGLLVDRSRDPGAYKKPRSRNGA